MKKYEYLYTRKEDKFIIPMLIRSIRDTGFVLNMPVKNLIEECMSSRESHTSEPLYTNVSFWPKDINCYANSFSCLFLSRIINSDMLKPSNITDAFIENFETYLCNFNNEHKNLFIEVCIASKKLIELFPISGNNIERILYCKTKDTLDLENINLITPYQI